MDAVVSLIAAIVLLVVCGLIYVMEKRERDRMQWRALQAAHRISLIGSATRQAMVDETLQRDRQSEGEQ